MRRRCPEAARHIRRGAGAARAAVARAGCIGRPARLRAGIPPLAARRTIVRAVSRLGTELRFGGGAPREREEREACGGKAKREHVPDLPVEGAHHGQAVKQASG
ncbi:Hypothetical protein A7982_03513 [Minicystis rosea]|nr:Hypothetical protein A7982_03513 [Minicystis rosea]